MKNNSVPVLAKSKILTIIFYNIHYMSPKIGEDINNEQICC